MIHDKGIVLDANLAFARLFGYEREEELIGRNGLELISPESRDRLRERIQRREMGPLEIICRRKDGSTFVAETNSRTMKYKGRNARLVSCRDITERKRAEQTLADSEHRYRQLVQSSPDAIVVHRNGVFLYANAAALALVGASGLGQLQENNLLNMVHPDDRDLVLSRLRQVERGEKIPLKEMRVIRLDGRETYVEAYASRVTYGTEKAIQVIIRDITERKLKDEALRESESRYRSLFQNMLDGFAYCRMIFDKDGHADDFIYLAVNESFYRLAGLKDVVGKRVTEVIPTIKELNPELFEIYGRVALKGSPERFEVEFKPLSRYLSVSVYSPANGFFVAVFDDITERRKAEEVLRQLNSELEKRVAERTAELSQAGEKIVAERQRFFDVLETLPVIVTLIRPDHRVAFVNQAYRVAFGDNQGKLCFAGQFGRAKPCEECQAFIPLETGQPHHWEWAIPDGRVFEIHNFPFMDADGSPMILEMDVDITARRKAEADLRQAHKSLATRADQLRALADELTVSEQRERKRLAKVLHDHLQQLLVAAKFRVAILSRGGDELLRQATSEVEELIGECISASRSLTAELSPPILHEAGLKAGVEWLVRRMADKQGLFVDLQADEITELPESIKILLFESVRELLFNVVKHAHSRSASVNVRRIDAGIQLTVSDEGAGFDPEKIPHAGEAGGGFGLFGIRERVDLMGGTLQIESSPGRGSRFVISLPTNKPAEIRPEIELAQKRSAMEIPRVISSDAGHKIRVLVADDHAVVRLGITNLLNDAPDIEVVGSAADGQEAVEMANKLLPDAILMDLSMPRLNGIEATRIIHNDYPDICIIGLSMFEEAERAQAMRDAGASHYLTKSGPAEELMRAIRKGTLSIQKTLSIQQ